MTEDEERKHDELEKEISLHPCPFCGDNHLAFHYSRSGDWVFVSCLNCDVEGPAVYVNNANRRIDAISLAADKWINRVTA